MKPSHAVTALGAALAADLPVFIWGAAGVGKSDLVRQVAASRGLALSDVRAILLDPVDLRGLPAVKDGRAVWCAPDFLPASGDGILFLDELNGAAPAVQSACYQLILDRAIGEYKLPAGWRIVAAGNRQSDRGVIHRMPAPLANRMLHLEVEADIEDWIVWATAAGLPGEVMAFLRFRSPLLHSFDPASASPAFPSPRAWAMLARVFSLRAGAEIEYPLYAGCVGEAAAVEFTGFLRVYRELPTTAAIFGNPAGAIVPSQPAALYAVAGNVAAALTTANMPAGLAYLARLPAEFQIMAVRDATRRDPDLQSTRQYIDWAIARQDVLA